MAELALTPALEDAILDSVARGTPAYIAAQANGVSAFTIQRWKAIASDNLDTWPHSDSPIAAPTKTRIVAFVARLAEAQASCFQVLTGALYSNATTIGRSGHTDTQAADKLLSKHPQYREVWYENRHQTTDVTVTHRLEEQLGQQALDSGDLATLRAWAALPDPSSQPTEG